MDKKQSNIPASSISKNVLRTLNKNFYYEQQKDENRISEIISEFISGEMDTINSILNSNEILNFKDQTNQTLIHAILRNESPNISEENKLEIIQKLVSDKNVSLHTMTNYNQNPLHLACQKGYSLIINYMINNDCDQTLVDNYGNAPIHYLIDKFIRECSDNDFYSQSNEQIKLQNSVELKKINNIVKNESLLLFNELFGIDKIGSEKYFYEDIGTIGFKIIDSIKKFTKNKVQSSLPIIYELINNKISEINKIFTEIGNSNEIKLEKAKNIIFGINNDVFQIYGLDLDFNNVVWNNFLNEQKLKIKNDKDNLMKKINKDIEIIKTLIFQDINNKIKNEFIDNIYTNLFKYVSGIFYLYYFIVYFVNRDTFSDGITDIDIELYFNEPNGNFKLVDDGTGKPSLLNYDNSGSAETDAYDEIMDEFENKVIKYLFRENFKVFTNGLDNINNLNEINYYDNYFLDDKSFKYEFCFDEDKNYCFDYIKLVEGEDVSGKYVFYIPNKLNYNKKINNFNNLSSQINNLKLNEIKDLNEDNIIDLLNENLGLDNYNFIYSPIRILIQSIFLFSNKIINLNLDKFTVKDEIMFTKSIQEFCLFDIKYLSECIFKMINNLVILEKYIDQIDIEGINEIFSDVYDKLTTSDDLNNEFKTIMDKFKYVIDETSISEEFILNLKSQKYKNTFDTLYDTFTTIIDRLKDILKNINEYFSLDQLEKYNEYLSEILNSPNTKPSIKINNTIFNNYEFNLSYPLKYKAYKNDFFSINENINLYELGSKNVPDLKDFIINQNYKNDLISKLWNYSNTYNFNIFFLDRHVTSGKFDYDIIYNVINIDNDVDLRLKRKLNNLKLEYYKYNLQNYIFSLTGGDNFKFSRGYDLLKYDILDNINNLKDNLGNLIIGKEEKKILCNMKMIENYSYYDKSTNSVEENDDKIVSWQMGNILEIKDINKFEPYIITNNLNELIKMLVFMIYEKIKENKISDVFFKKLDLTLQNLKVPTEKITKSIGIDLNYNGLDETSKTNIIDTLGFIQVNPEQRKQYLFDNIKSFVKIIVNEEINKEIFKIMDEITISNLSIDKMSIEQQQITSSDSIDKFNNSLKKINLEYKNVFWPLKLNEIVRKISSPILDFQEILNLSKYNTTKLEQSKILNSKCLNKSKTDELMDIDMNYKVLDKNGNTILIRLIEQFNIYGIKKLIEKNKKVLFTYKNINMELPLDYLNNSLKNIQSEYLDTEFKYRMDRYSSALENSIKSNSQFDGIELSNSNNLVTEIITNSIYLFNESIWLRVYLYPSGWTIDEKNNLKKILEFSKEELLINSFDSNDMANYIDSIKTNSELKMSTYIKILEDEIEQLKNRAKELNLESSNNFIINQSGYNIKDNITNINNKIKDKENTLQTYRDYIKKINGESYKSSNDEILKIFDKYNNKLLDINNLEINWFEYMNLLNELDDKYIGIIKILNNKCLNYNCISNYLIKIYCNDITQETNFKLINKYFKYIFNKVFNDYWDLDRYENSDYNVTNKSIIQILKINVIGIIKNEFLNTLANYIIQLNKYLKNTKQIINDIKNNKDLIKSIKIYLYECLIRKIKLNNPDKSSIEINIDKQKIIILNTLKKILKTDFNETEQNEIKKIIEFNKFVCENIGLNCYEEIIKILYDGKKISLYYEIYDIIYNEINEI